MFHSHFQAGPNNEPPSHDHSEQLISNASKQYGRLHYPGPLVLELPNQIRNQSYYDHWPRLAAAAVLVAIVVTMGIWLPGDERMSKPTATAIWQPESRQPSPHAALAAARGVLAGHTSFPRPESPEAYRFNIPAAPSRDSGFAPKQNQPS